MGRLAVKLPVSSVPTQNCLEMQILLKYFSKMWLDSGPVIFGKLLRNKQYCTSNLNWMQRGVDRTSKVGRAHLKL